MAYMDKDYYRILGLTRGADERAIKVAFRRQARRYHPDVNAGDPAAERLFKDINEAYKTLGDPARRRRYDAARDASTTSSSPEAHGAGRSAASTPRPQPAEPGPWGRFWRDERAALAYTAHWARRRIARLRTGILLVALVCGVLFFTLAWQWVEPRRAAPPSPGEPSRLSVTRHQTPTAPRHTPVAPVARGRADHQPLYLYGGCVRYCPPSPTETAKP